MSTQVNHLVMYGVKLPFFHDNLSEEFNEFLSEFHNFHREWINIEPDRIYVVSDALGGTYSIVGYIIDITTPECGFDEFVDLSTTGDQEKIFEFLWKKEFEGVIGDDIPEAELLIFTHYS